MIDIMEHFLNTNKGDENFQLDYSITQHWDCPTGLIKICLLLDHGKIARKYL